MNIATASRADLEVVILEEDILTDLDAASAMSDDELREVVHAWILEAPDAEFEIVRVPS